MKIAFFLGQFPVLSETFVIRQVTGLVEAGHDVTIVMGEWGDKALSHEKYQSLRLQDKVHPLRVDVGGKLSRATMIAGFALKSLFSRRGRTMLWAGARAAATGCPAALMDIAAQSRFGKVGRFDAIIAHFGQVGVRAMYLQQAGLIDGPIATVFHGFDMSERALVKRNLGNFKRMFTRTAMALPISELWRDKLLSWGACPNRVRVLRMGVDLDRLVMQDSHRPMGKPLQVLSVARFTEKKGLEYAIGGVIAANAASSTSVHYSLIGSGVLDAPLRATAAAAPAAQIDFLGKRAQHEVFEALGNTDVFLLPSVTARSGDMEGVPVVLMEAMAKGVLVVATRHSGIPELVVDGVSGLLVEERDAAGIAAALKRIASGDVDVSTIRLNARRMVETSFNNTILDQELIDICAMLQEREFAEPHHLQPSGQKAGIDQYPIRKTR